MTTWVRKKAAEYDAFDDTFLKPHEKKVDRKSTHLSEKKITRTVLSKLGDGDIKGAIRLLAQESTIATDNVHTMQELISKHPEHPEPAFFPAQDWDLSSSLNVSVGQVFRMVRSFAPGSSGGLECLHPQILNDLLQPRRLVNRFEDDPFLSELTSFVNFVASSPLPPQARRLFFGASLTALLKRNGGIRPIAVGNSLRRLVSKCVLQAILPSLTSYLAPQQLGVGVKGGIEAAVHGTRNWINSVNGQGKILLKLDYRNAFNEIRRDVILQIVRQQFPSAFPYIFESIGNESHIYYGEHLIVSKRGVQQGDPLGPALFSLGIHEMVRSLENLDINIFYLDDGSLGGTPNSVQKAVKEAILKSEELGLTLNPSKCELLFTDDAVEQKVVESFESILPGVKILDKTTASLLGSALTPEAQSHILKDKTANLITMGTLLLALPAHAAFYLLSKSLSIPSLIYFLRCFPTTEYHDEELKDYDDALRNILSKIMEVPCNTDDHMWEQICMKPSQGGFGLRQVAKTSVACYLSSINAASPIIEKIVPPTTMLCLQVEVSAAVAHWRSVSGEVLSPPTEYHGSQAAWEGPIHTRTFSSLCEGAYEPIDKAQLQAAAHPSSSYWMQALPSKKLGTLLTNQEFRVSCGLRLGAKLFTPFKCARGNCEALVDSRGLHGLSCKFGPEVIGRHNEINKEIGRALSTALVPNRIEVTGICQGGNRRPDGRTYVTWDKGRYMAWDVTVRDTFADSNIPKTSKQAGAACAVAENLKRQIYEPLLGSQFIFIPLAFETSGVWGEESSKFVKEVGRRIAEVNGDHRSTSFLRQRISLTLVKQVSNCILASLPKGDPLDEVLRVHGLGAGPLLG